MSEQHYVFKDGKQHAVVPLAEVERWKAISESATKVLAKYDQIKPMMDALAFNGIPYTGDNWGEEIDALRAALGSKP